MIAHLSQILDIVEYFFVASRGPVLNVVHGANFALHSEFPLFVDDLDLSASWLVLGIFQGTDFGAAVPFQLFVFDLFVSSARFVSRVFGICSGFSFPLEFSVLDFDFSAARSMRGVLQAANFRLDLLQIGRLGHTNDDFIHRNFFD